MNTAVLPRSSHHEPGLFLAGVLALLVHFIFVVFMFFGLNWKTQPPEGLIVDLWHDLPQPFHPAVKQPPIKTEPIQPSSAQKPAQEKSPPPKITSPSPAKKPEIIRKEMKEEPKPVAEKEPIEEVQKESEREKQTQKENEEAEKANELKKQKEQEEAAKAEAQRLQREQEALVAQRKAQQAAERTRIMNEINKYQAMILAKVRSRIVMPTDLPGNPMAEFSVTLLPGGDILDVQLRKGSGYVSFDSAVERAIFLAKPLPLPPNPALFREFRNLKITVHYHE